MLGDYNVMLGSQAAVRGSQGAMLSSQIAMLGSQDAMLGNQIPVLGGQGAVLVCHASHCPPPLPLHGLRARPAQRVLACAGVPHGRLPRTPRSVLIVCPVHHVTCEPFLAVGKKRAPNLPPMASVGRPPFWNDPPVANSAAARSVARGWLLAARLRPICLPSMFVRGDRGAPPSGERARVASRAALPRIGGIWGAVGYDEVVLPELRGLCLLFVRVSGELAL